MAKKSPVGWLILVLVLALPGLIFYFGWVRLREKRVSRYPGAPPPLGQVFNSAPPGVRVLNSQPLKPLVPPAKTTRKTLVPSISRLSTSSRTALGGGAHSLPASSNFVAKLSSATPPALAAAKPATLQTQEVAVPSLKRDPTLSPADAKEIYDLLHPKPKPKPKPKVVRYRPKKKKGPPIETLIDLEGIIFVSPTNAKAIINGDIMKVGGLVYGAKIVRIEKQKVIFSYHGRQVIKVMSSKL